MKGMSQYGAVATKIRGMRSHLLKYDEYAALASKANVKEIVAYLKNHPSYQVALSEINPDNMRRVTFERALLHSIFLDFGKISHFLDSRQKRFLDVYATHFDLRLINNIIREIFIRHEEPVDLTVYREMYENSHNLNFDKIVDARNIDELLLGLSGTIYYEPVSTVRNTIEDPELFDYETALNRFYFSYFWDELERFHSQYDKETLLEIHGFEIDMLNIIWIYRAKEFYKLSPAEIYRFLIPAYPKLKSRQISDMVAAADTRELMRIISTTAYRKYIDPRDPASLEMAYEKGKLNIHEKNRREYPYSFAVIEAYLYDKRTEVERIIKIAESVRYGYSPSLILNILNIRGEN